jgi:hypothetical protein
MSTAPSRRVLNQFLAERKENWFGCLDSARTCGAPLAWAEGQGEQKGGPRLRGLKDWRDESSRGNAQQRESKPQR